MGLRRIHYIGWLRVLAVLLLFPFHTCRVYNANDPFYVKSAETSIALSYAISLVDRWHMTLLFILAGVSTYLALGKRGTVTFAFERVKRSSRRRRRRSHDGQKSGRHSVRSAVPSRTPAAGNNTLGKL